MFDLLSVSIKMLKLNKFFAEAKKYPCPNIKRQNRAKIQIICFFDKFMLINLIIWFNILISRVFPLFISIVHNITHKKTYSFWDTCYINVITHVVLFFSLFTIFLLFIIVYCCMINISTPNSQHLHIKIERQNDSSQRPSQARKSCSKGENSDFFLRRPKKFEAVKTSNPTLVLCLGNSPKGGFEFGF